MSSPFGADELFFGSQRVHLKNVPGQAINYTHADYKLGTAPEQVAKVIARKELIPMQDGGLPITEPAVPALDPVCTKAPNTDVSLWPTLLQTPLIKVPESEKAEDEPVAFASGTRSATVKLNGEFFRLKGCGNNDQGFLVRTEEKLGFRDIRGSAFLHTSLCELYNTKALELAMKPDGVQGANESMGYYTYASPNAPLDDVCVPACIVEKTFGDRRLGTHVLAGLELLLPDLVEESKVDVSGLKALFPDFRQVVAQSKMAALDPVVPTADFLGDHQIAFSMDPSMNGLTWGMPRDSKAFADCLSSALPETTPDAKTLPEIYFKENGVEGGPRPANPRWADQWANACAELQTAIDYVAEGKTSSAGSVLAYLYSRIGAEAGKILRCMHAANTSWGTYKDNMCYEGQLHCNAHNNNLTILSQGTSPTSFLSYLDLDMAFSNEAFVDVYGDGKVGTDLATHQALLKFESVQMMEVLAGNDTTSGVPRVARDEMNARGSALRLVLNSLRDVMMLGFLKEYNGEDCAVATPDPQLHAGAYALLKLAIIKQADFAA